MDKISREQFLACLDENWQVFIDRFERLSPTSQQSFLEKQGYEAFSHLLAHVVAWWQDGCQSIKAMRADPALPLANYDVNAFNAQAIERLNGFSRVEMGQMFMAQHQVIRDLVANLSDAEISQENINTRLYYEIISHWSEHALE